MMDHHILGNLDVTDFLKDYWQKKPLLIRQAIPAFTSPLDANELAGLACEVEVESRLVQRRDDQWSLQSGPFDAKTLRRLPARDWTLLVQDVDKHLPELAEYLDLFDFIPQWRIDDLMISVAAEGGGVGPHTDAYDVFLLQAQGRRRWSIAERFDPAIIEGMELRVLKHFTAEQEWILEPGDMLYLPPDIAHHGVALDGNCMTWSIGFRAPSLRDMFSDFSEWLLQRLPEDAMYADPDLERGEAAGGRISAAGFGRMLQLMRSALATPDAELQRWFGCFITEPKPWLRCEPPEQPLNGAQLHARLGQGLALRRDSRARLAWAPLQEQAVLFVDGEAWDLPAGQSELLELACTRRRLAMNDLSPLLDSDAVALLLRLHQHGVLAFDAGMEEDFDHGR